MNLFEIVKEIPAGWQARCTICRSSVDAIAIVAIIEPDPVVLYRGALVFHDVSRAISLVGPCGHSSLDTEGHVYIMTREADTRGDIEGGITEVRR